MFVPYTKILYTSIWLPASDIHNNNKNIIQQMFNNFYC